MLIEKGNQYTIKEMVTAKGLGLHSGKTITISLRPAGAGVGFLFRRLDLPFPSEVVAAPERVVDTKRATTLAEGGTKIMTVEHLLAAFSLMEIDNAIIELDGEEIPIFDGSAKGLVNLIMKAGKVELEGQPRLVRKIDKYDSLQSGDATIALLPAESFRITYGFFAPPPCHNQVVDWEMGDFQPALARTFGWHHEIEHLQKQGLIKGGNKDCALLFSKGEKPPQLRFDYEPAWHKVLDLLGDLALYRPIIGHVIALGAGHTLHNQLARKLKEEENK